MRTNNPHQGTGAWFNERTGKLTASRMRSAMKRLKTGEDSAERRNLKIEILAERLTGDIVPKFSTAAMQWGIDNEPFAKETYEQVTGRVIQDCGFFNHPSIEFCGASPDGLVEEGLIEVKCPTTGTHLEWVLQGEVPAEYKPQMTLQAAVTGRPWVDFVSFDPRVPAPHQLFVRRFYLTPSELEHIEDEALRFLEEVDVMFETLTTREMVE